MLVEEKIILLSTSYRLLTLACEGITQLIQPLNFNFVYIPVLPKYASYALQTHVLGLISF